jgi:two-component system response regulator FixJ
MPGIDGIEVVKALGDLVQQFPIIMMTGHGDIPTAVRAMKLGAVDFLEKPFSEALVLETLEGAFKTLDAGMDARNRQSAAKARLDKLSPRERDVLNGLSQGLSNKVIAFRLDLSVRTVEMYRGTMMERLKVKSLPEAMRLAFVVGMLDEDAAGKLDKSGCGATAVATGAVPPILLQH